MQNLIALAPIPEVANFPLNFGFNESVGLPLDGSDFHPGADLPRTGVRWNPIAGIGLVD